MNTHGRNTLDSLMKSLRCERRGTRGQCVHACTQPASGSTYVRLSFFLSFSPFTPSSPPLSLPLSPVLSSSLFPPPSLSRVRVTFQRIPGVTRKLTLPCRPSTVDTHWPLSIGRMIITVHYPDRARGTSNATQLDEVSPLIKL